MGIQSCSPEWNLNGSDVCHCHTWRIKNLKHSLPYSFMANCNGNPQSPRREHKLKMAEPLSAWTPKRLHIAGKMFASLITDKVLVSRIYKQPHMWIRKQNSPVEGKKARIVIRQFERSRKPNCVWTADKMLTLTTSKWNPN